MDSIDHGMPSFWTQADALFRKNVIFQKRQMKQTCALIFFPALLCALIVSFQTVIDAELKKPEFQCGCQCVNLLRRDGPCVEMCGPEFSTNKQIASCAIPSPREWPALLQIPTPYFRATRTASHRYPSLDSDSCRKDWSCPSTALFTGLDRNIAAGIMEGMDQNAYKLDTNAIPHRIPLYLLDSSIESLSKSYLGTNSIPGFQNYVEHALISAAPLCFIQPTCPQNYRISIELSLNRTKDLYCFENRNVWRANSSSINKELFEGYRNGNPQREIHEIATAYDFLNTNKDNYNVSVWYNSTYVGITENRRMLRIPKSVNLATNAFLRQFKGRELEVEIKFVKEMPKPEDLARLRLHAIVGPLFYSWVLQLLFPIFLTSLVYEKQHKLRIMMKLHGLQDAPYWVVTYSFFLLISTLYMIWSAIFGYLIGLDIFRLNDIDVQIVFYLFYLNLQIALAFLCGNLFSRVKSSTVAAYIYVFGSGLLGDSLFKFYIEDTTLPKWRMMVMELFPGFSLYRGLYELQQYGVSASYMNTRGMRWKNMNDEENGMKTILIIMASEWFVLLCVAYLLEKITFSGSLVQIYRRNFLKKLTNATSQAPIAPISAQSSTITIDSEFPDLLEERNKIEQLLAEPQNTHPIFCLDLEKVYNGKDGAPKKSAVKGLSLSIQRGECFGLLGPSGSGKTTLIKMLTGFSLPSSGSAFINSTDVTMAMNQIQTRMGVCPQQDVIWDILTGREHLLFYGRLRNLKGAELKNAVEQSLKSFNLYKCNAGDQRVGAYSGGMKRRLSVAIALIGNTQVVFLDEPSGGLDIDSRNYLWHVIKKERAGRAIMLTTHSMEEADFLCDRLGIIVNGKLQCLGDSKELKARYGRSHLFTISLNPLQKVDVETMVAGLSPNSVKVYDVGGTLKFQLPKRDVRICDVFEAVDSFRKEIPIYGFGLNESSLEDVFINVVDEALEY